LEWQRDGLAEPAAIAKAIAGYRAEMDFIGDFIGDRCNVATSSELRVKMRTKTAALYGAYTDWCRTNGAEPLTARRFGTEMGRRGYPLEKSNSASFRVGLMLQDGS
jgi:putative DNA primase/helicase